MATLGLVAVPKEIRSDSELSFGGVSITQVIGDGGRSWEMWSMSSVGLKLKRQDASSLDMERGAVGVVDFAGVGGASTVVEIVRKFPKGILAALTVQLWQILWH